VSDLGFPRRHFVDRISARAPTVDEAETLDLPDGTPVIRQLRVIYSDARYHKPGPPQNTTPSPLDTT
jgi:DNA-binding GntR family transcriptional regulator